MKYKVGDRVKVKEDARKIKDPDIAFVEEMYWYSGKEFTVRSIEETWYYPGKLYTLEGAEHSNNQYWKFSELWLENADIEIVLKEEVTDQDIINILN